MSVLDNYRNWSRRRATAEQLRSMSQRQLEDIGVFEAENADRVRGLIPGL